ncbi:MAG: HigA family addiction module antitoxin [Desulfatibacillaceae bacterium]|nr:HigA family addiction module antitoxin [Desulfatibacillaceae bacterium]
MPVRSKFQTTTDVAARRLPKNRPPTHPGQMLLEEFIRPLGLTQAELARSLAISYPRLNEIINAKRSVTPDTALRFSRVLGMPADFWLGLQQDWDLWHAMQGPDAKQINKLKPIARERYCLA